MQNDAISSQKSSWQVAMLPLQVLPVYEALESIASEVQWGNT